MTATPLPVNDGMSRWRQALWILLAGTVIRLLLGAVIPLYADEAYYWEWSRRLAPGYFDHPPVIAWLIALGTALLGDTTVGVRLFPILCGTGFGLAVARTAFHLAGPSAARFAALCAVLIPGLATGFVLATPDAPLLAALACTLHCVVRAIGDDATPRAALRWWLLAGVAVGAAMASKFTGVFLPIGVAIAFALHPALRRHFRAPGPWLAVAVASLLMLPVLLWNVQHDWVSFRFQLAHGFAASPRGSWWGREAELLGGQLGIATPILLVLLGVAVVRALRAPREPRRFTLGVVAAVSAAVFVYSATRRPVEPNWPMIAWVPALVLLAALRPAMRTRWEHRGIRLAVVFTGLVVAHALVPFVPLNPQRDPILKAYGWREAARLVGDETRAFFPDPEHVVLLAPRYQDAALLAWNRRDHPTVYVQAPRGRRSQYDLWPGVPEGIGAGADFVYLARDTAVTPTAALADLAARFDSAAPGSVVRIHRGARVIGARRIWRLIGWGGTLPPASDSIVTPSLR